MRLIMEVKITFASLFILTFLYRCFLTYFTNNMDDHVRIGNITNIKDAKDLRTCLIKRARRSLNLADLLLITTGIDH